VEPVWDVENRKQSKKQSRDRSVRSDITKKRNIKKLEQKKNWNEKETLST